LEKFVALFPSMTMAASDSGRLEHRCAVAEAVAVTAVHRLYACPPNWREQSSPSQLERPTAASRILKVCVFDP